MANNSVMDWVIPAHAAVATIALTLGAYNLLRKRKGDRSHRIVGRVWVASMYATIISSLFIRELRPGGFSWIHGLSAFTFVTLTVALWAAMTGRVHTHRHFVTGSYLGLVGAFIGAVAVPVRYLPRHIAERPAEVGLALFGLVVVTLAIIRASRAQGTQVGGQA